MAKEKNWKFKREWLIKIRRYSLLFFIFSNNERIIDMKHIYEVLIG